MMIGRFILAAVAASTVLPVNVTAQERSFACDGGSSDQAAISERTDNFSMQLILAIYRDRWDAGYIRAQCEAFANGEPYTITCLKDVRDWDAIEASVPDDYYGMDRFSLAEFVPNEREKGPIPGPSYEYCREVGAIK